MHSYGVEEGDARGECGGVRCGEGCGCGVCGGVIAWGAGE